MKLHINSQGFRQKFCQGVRKIFRGPLQSKFSLKKVRDLFKVFDNVDSITGSKLHPKQNKKHIVRE